MDTFYSTAVQYCSRYNISTKNRIHIIYYLYIKSLDIFLCLSWMCRYLWSRVRTCSVCISNKWTLEAHRSQGSKCDKSATNLQHQHCTSCTLLHLAAPSPQFSCKMSIWQFIAKKVPRQPRDILSNI